MKFKKLLKIILVIFLLTSGLITLALWHEAKKNPCLKKAESLKRGMTRAQVIKIFEFEGFDNNVNNSSLIQKNGYTEIFALHDCPCADKKAYKIKIDFKPAHIFSSWMDLKTNYKMRGQDKIIKISMPVCEPLEKYDENY